MNPRLVDLAIWAVATGVAFAVSYWGKQKREPKPEDYFESGYRFKFLIIDGQNASQEELDSYSDSLKDYDTFVQKYAKRPVKVVRLKNEKLTFSASFGKLINVPGMACYPASIWDRHEDTNRPELYQLLRDSFTNRRQNEAVILHELGHIENDHFKRSIHLGIPLIPLAVATMISTWRGNYYLCPVFLVCAGYIQHQIVQHEYEADAFATKHGYGNELIEYLKKCMEINRNSGDIFCTASGENLRDIDHPFIRNRIIRIEQLMDELITTRC